MNTINEYPKLAGLTETVPTEATQVEPKVSYVLTVLLNRLANDARLLDQVKKWIYYGNRKVSIEQIQSDVEVGNLQVQHPAEGFKLDPIQRRILHCCMGLLTEAGEMAEAVLANLVNGVPLDQTNIMEEIGDGYWYSAIPINVYGWTMQQVLEANVEKLRKRYPQGFTEEAAANRDLAGERKILEGHATSESKA